MGLHAQPFCTLKLASYFPYLPENNSVASVKMKKMKPPNLYIVEVKGKHRGGSQVFRVAMRGLDVLAAALQQKRQ
jgi:hypothetical protein